MIRPILLSIFVLIGLAHAFDVTNARRVLDQLSSDSFEGRRPGHPGGKIAEEFVAAQFTDYGVEPAGVNGYFQTVPILVTKEDASALTLMNGPLGKISFELGIDYTLVTHSGSGAFVAPVIVAGMGYFLPEKGRDDYGDLDVHGKIVVIERGTPESPYDFSEDFSRSEVLKTASERGAAAVLWHAYDFPLNGAAIKKESREPDMPLMYVGDRVMRLVLDGTGYSPKTYKEKLKTEPIPLETGKEMWVSVRVRELPSADGRNVIGIVYGKDPVLRNEIIVVGGHLDHCGLNGNGVAYNGADDNGSGSAVVSELARAIAKGEPLKRNVMFIHFTAEEDGLLGSEFFVKNSTIPFGNVACMLNFDMVGQGDGIVGMDGGELLGHVWEDYLATLSDSDKAKQKLGRSDGGGASDHASFIEGGAPSLFIHSTGSHPFYHQYTDDSESISDSVMLTVGSQAEKLLRYLADYTTPFACRSDSIRILAGIATTIDFKGFFLDASATVPKLATINSAWLPHDSGIPALELARRASELHHFAKEHKLSSTGLKDAVNAWNEVRSGVFLSIPEATLSNKTAAEAGMLVRQGLSCVSLTPGNSKGGRISKEVETELLDGGVYAMIPLDFSTPAQVATWKKKAIVTCELTEFLALSEEVRAPLLTSDAMVVLEVKDQPTVEQLEAINPGRERLVHLNFGTQYDELRETDQKATIRTLYEAGFTRNDILRLTGGNLQRFLR